jgi:hypothetical protein
MTEAEEVDDQNVQCQDIDAGSGSETLALGSDWVEYLSQLEVPSNVTGVDEGIEDFEEWANV